MPGPGQVARDGVRRGPAGEHGGEAEREPLVVVGDQLVDRARAWTASRPRARGAGAGPASRGPWRGSRGSRRAAGRRTPARTRSTGVIVGSTWSPANSRPAVEVGEDEVPLGVAGRRDRVDRAGDRPRAAGRRRARCRGTPTSTGPAPGRPSPPASRPPRRRRRRGGSAGWSGRRRRPAANDVQRGPVAETEADVRPDLAADRHRLRVVVAVRVGDQEPGDVGDRRPIARATRRAARETRRAPSRRRRG